MTNRKSQLIWSMNAKSTSNISVSLLKRVSLTRVCRLRQKRGQYPLTSPIGTRSRDKKLNWSSTAKSMSNIRVSLPKRVRLTRNCQFVPKRDQFHLMSLTSANNKKGLLRRLCTAKNMNSINVSSPRPNSTKSLCHDHRRHLITKKAKRFATNRKPR